MSLSSLWSSHTHSHPHLQAPLLYDDAQMSAPRCCSGHLSRAWRPHLTSLRPYFRCSHLQICQNSRTPGVSCQQMARTSPASIRPPAVQALSFLPSSVLNQATGPHSTEPRGHLFITVLIKGRHTDSVYCLAEVVSRSCLEKEVPSSFVDEMSLGWEEAAC